MQYVHSNPMDMQARDDGVSPFRSPWPTLDVPVQAELTSRADRHFEDLKAVLAACSKFLYKFLMFVQEPLVEIEGVSKVAFRHLIESTYTAK